MKPVNQQRVLLIGGGGFIGQHLSNACQAVGMAVRIADVKIPDDVVNDPGVEYIHGDYRDAEFLRYIVTDVDCVVHLAHEAIHLDVACDMTKEFDRNILPVIQLMDMCGESSVSKLLFVSSGGTVYGDRVSSEPIPEDAPTQPISVYGATKLMIEKLGLLYYAQKNLPFIIARPGNAYGEGQMPFRGQGFIATALASAKSGRSLSIFGDGSAVRDYIHVTDIANALVSIIINGMIGETYNLGTACGTSLRTLVDDYIAPMLLEDGLTLSFTYDPERRADVSFNVLSNEKLLLETGFCPKIELGDGLRCTWEWIKNNPDVIS